MHAKFVYLYHVLTRPNEKKILTSAIKRSQATIDKECTIPSDWIGYLGARIFYVTDLSGWDITIAEPALSAVNAQISGRKEPVTMQPLNLPPFPLTMWPRPRTQASYQSAAIQITWDEVKDYSDEYKDAIVIVDSKVK